MLDQIISRIFQVLFRMVESCFVLTSRRLGCVISGLILRSPVSLLVFSSHFLHVILSEDNNFIVVLGYSNLFHNILSSPQQWSYMVYFSSFPEDINLLITDFVVSDIFMWFLCVSMYKPVYFCLLFLYVFEDLRNRQVDIKQKQKTYGSRHLLISQIKILNIMYVYEFMNFSQKLSKFWITISIFLLHDIHFIHC